MLSPNTNIRYSSEGGLLTEIDETESHKDKLYGAIKFSGSDSTYTELKLDSIEFISAAISVLL